MSEWLTALEGGLSTVLMQSSNIVGPTYWPWIQATGLAALVFIVFLAIKGSVIRLIRDGIIRLRWGFGSYLIKHQLFTRLLSLVLVIGGLQIAAVYIQDPIVTPLMAKIGQALTIIMSAQLVYSVLDAVMDILQHRGVSKKLPVKSLIQLAKIITVLVCGIVLVSVLLGKSPMYLLSGLGALSAVLMLVFKDSLLGLVAGIQITAHKLVEVGDWIEIDGADGEVIDISLQTVKIRNWNNTISSIPAYRLVSETLKNWTPMSTKGRQIKRSVWIDLNSIGFLTDADLSKLRKVRLLSDYLASKQKSITLDDRHSPSSHEARALNGRTLTNIGTFRAYVERYLKQHPAISQKETLLVRQLASKDTGLPIEIYCFTENTAWAHYESVQADIFDHLLAILPEFGLRAFQHPSGQDLRALQSSGHQAQMYV